jgi:hypothetical protein
VRFRRPSRSSLTSKSAGARSSGGRSRFAHQAIPGALVRPAGERRLQRSAGRTSASNAASGWGTPDLATLIHDRRQIGSGCHAVRGNRTIMQITMKTLINQQQRASADHDHEQLQVPTVARDRCPLRSRAVLPREKARITGPFYQADDGARTRDLRLGKPTLYQLSYVRARVILGAAGIHRDPRHPLPPRSSADPCNPSHHPAPAATREARATAGTERV